MNNVTLEATQIISVRVDNKDIKELARMKEKQAEMHQQLMSASPDKVVFQRHDRL